jgi:hypothetical protein
MNMHTWNIYLEVDTDCSASSLFLDVSVEHGSQLTLTQNSPTNIIYLSPLILNSEIFSSQNELLELF